ncbi:Hint domain-containing protein [Roseovarius aestuarii]|nr:Hint domain-containing protein [Roseovarius aestuarii]
MGWIGLGDHDGGRFDARGLSCAEPNTPQVATGDVAARGTLLIETYISPEGRPQTLLEFERTHPWSGQVSIQVVPSGGIVLVEALGDDVRHAAVMHDLDGRSDQLRVSYSWDAPGRWGRLALEHLSQGRIYNRVMPPPHPIQMDDLRMITRYPTRRTMDADVAFMAVSDQVEPLGPMPGLTSHVPVATPHGDVPVGRLKRGDTVLTSAGEIVPILHTVRQTLPARGSLRPVRLRAPYFGLKRDILVAPHQRLVIGGSQVEYMFGTEAALVPSRHLVNGTSAFYADGPDLVTYHHLLLPGHQVLLAAGCPVESLYIGRLRRDPTALRASVLAGFDRARLPEHPRPIWPVLKPFEAVTLAMVRAA